MSTLENRMLCASNVESTWSGTMSIFLNYGRFGHNPFGRSAFFTPVFIVSFPPIPTPQFPSFLGSGSKSSRRKTREETKWDDDTERVIESCENHNNKHRWRQPPGNAAITHEQTDKDEDIHKKVWKIRKTSITYRKL